MDNNIIVVRSKRKTLAIEIKSNGSVYLRAPLFASDSEIEDFINLKKTWIDTHLQRLKSIKEEAEKVKKLTDDEISSLKLSAELHIPKRVEFYAEKMGLDYGKISIKLQKTRWGSCSVRKNLNFNCLLMLAPGEVIDSVVVHELCHLKEMNHSKNFYELVYSYFPDYYRCNSWLKKNGSRLINRAFDLF